MMVVLALLGMGAMLLIAVVFLLLQIAKWLAVAFIIAVVIAIIGYAVWLERSAKPGTYSEPKEKR